MKQRIITGLICGVLFIGCLVLMNTICASGGIFMSQFKGAKDKEGMEQTFKFKLITFKIEY